MFRLWAKIIKDNHLLKDLTVENDTEDTRTHKVFPRQTDLAGVQHRGISAPRQNQIFAGSIHRNDSL